ncbi:MAG: hypothetical protein NVSMB6_27540 [Burkholderiaceae bacterium]
MKKPKAVQWLDAPTDKDYAASETYLQLLYGPKKARRWAKALKGADVQKFSAKDILRASATPISEVQAFDWVKQEKEIQDGTALAPILLVRQENGGHLIIADGFHRLCAVFCRDQEASIPCKLV